MKFTHPQPCVIETVNWDTSCTDLLTHSGWNRWVSRDQLLTSLDRFLHHNFKLQLYWCWQQLKDWSGDMFRSPMHSC